MCRAGTNVIHIKPRRDYQKEFEELLRREKDIERTESKSMSKNPRLSENTSEYQLPRSIQDGHNQISI